MPSRTAFLVTLFVALAARAEMPTDLALPLDCTPGEDCWILRYVDLDPEPGAQDYMCGELTSDGHQGTDFAIRNLAVMAEGVLVRAAAAGVVEGVARRRARHQRRRRRARGDRRPGVRQRHPHRGMATAGPASTATCGAAA